MTKQLLFGVAALCLVLGACGGGSESNDECSNAADCATGQICDDGTCKDDVTPPACDPACTGATPVCDEATGTCKTCMADTDCSGATPACDTTANGGVGACVACLGTSDCTAPSVCDTATHTCVGCTDTEGCGDTAPVCEDGTCVVCTATEGCDAGQICDLAVEGGKCVTCTATDGCEADQVCDLTVENGECVTCLADGTGCDGGDVCDTSVPGGECVECTGEDDCPGAAVCDLTRNECVTCTADNAGCRGSFPYCDVTAAGGEGECVQCLSNDHCGGDYPVCDPARHSCAICVTHDDCGGDTPFCDPIFPGLCVACIDNTQCGGDTPICDRISNPTGACEPCSPAAGCGMGKFCQTVPDGLNECRTCTATRGCTNGKVCDMDVPGGACVTCTATGGCDATHVCDTTVAGGACVVCLPDGTGCDAGEACDAGACRNAASVGIDAVRAAAADTSIDVLVDGAYVTYLRPGLSTSDPAGFFVQGEASGPAMLVMVDPATLTPAPLVGDKVSFHATMKQVYGTATEASAITGWTVASHGADLTPFVQNLSSAADVITNLDGYEAELISITGTLATSFGAAGSGHSSAQFTTAGITTASADLRLRMATTLKDSLDLTQGCAFTLVAGPMWRYNLQAQPSAYYASDLSGITCPAPALVSATTPSATSVILTFDRVLDPASVLANGSQFTFDNGLVASAAVASGKTVTVTTSAQSGTTVYAVTVAATVLGLHGTPVVSSSVMFPGFLVPAAMIINEVNPNIGSNKDLVELKVLTGGTTAGFVLQMDLNSPVTLAALPAVIVAAGDYILVHVTPGPETSAETLAKNEKPQATYAGNVDGAWDFAGIAANITYSGRLVVLKNAVGTIVDGVSFYRAGSTSSSTFPPQVQALQAAGQWLPADCGGVACTTVPLAESISANWANCGTTATGASMARVGATDTNLAADWTLAATPTWGVANQ